MGWLIAAILVAWITMAYFDDDDDDHGPDDDDLIYGWT